MDPEDDILVVAAQEKCECAKGQFPFSLLKTMNMTWALQVARESEPIATKSEDNSVFDKLTIAKGVSDISTGEFHSWGFQKASSSHYSIKDWI